MDGHDLVAKQELVWRSIEQLCSAFSGQDWKRPTDCPGWSVQDQLSHLVGTESSLLGRREPEHTPPGSLHVKNEFAARNEVQVDWRRPWQGTRVLEEFREVVRERAQALRSLTPEGWEARTMTPIGPSTVAEHVRIRIFDHWVHEQDMRRALGRPGHLEGPVAEHSVGRVATAMPFVVGKKAGAPEGTTVVFDIGGGAGFVFAIGVEGQRASRLERVPESPDARLIMDSETFACLGCGRWSPETVLGDGRVGLQGDEYLARTVVMEMGFMI